MNSKFFEIVRILQYDDSTFVSEQLNQYLSELVSFDELVDDNGDTLIHYWLKHIKEFPDGNFSFLEKCFFACDHVNKLSETPLHVLLKYCPEAIKCFKYLVKSGCSIFKNYGSNKSVFENIFIHDQNESNLSCKLCFEYLISRPYEGAYIKKNFYEILSYIFRNKSLNILSCLLDKFCDPFENFIRNINQSGSTKKEKTAKQLFLETIANSNREIFTVLFKKDYKIHKNLLFHCTNREFCLYLYLSEHVYGELEFDINTKDVDPKIMALLVDLTDGVYKSRLIIHEAAEKGDIDFIRKISPIMLDSTDYRGDTPLLYAIKNNKENVAIYLVESGKCDFCHLGSETTPLHLAAQGRPRILEKMFTTGKKGKNVFIDVNVLDKQKQTPLVALFNTERMNETKPECINKLIDNGADISLCDTNGFNILDLSVKRRVAQDVIDLLINRGLKPSKKGEMRFILMISNKFHHDAYNLLLEKFGVDLEEGKEILTSKDSKNPNDLDVIIDKMLEIKATLDFFFNCFEKAVENDNDVSANILLERVNDLRFYICNNRSVLSVLSEKTGHFKDLSSPIYSIYKNVFNGISEKKKDIYLFQDKSTGDNFIHIALYKNNINFLNLILSTYLSQNIENKVNITNSKFKKEINKDSVIEFGENAEGLNVFKKQMSLVFKQWNSKNISPVELAASRYISLKNVFSFEFFSEKPSEDTLLKFLNKVKNPNITDASGMPLLLFYLSDKDLNDDVVLNFLIIFSKFKCDFNVEFDKKNAAKICFDRNFFKSFEFILDNGGSIRIIEQISQYKELCKKDKKLHILSNKIEKISSLKILFDEFLEAINRRYQSISTVLEADQKVEFVVLPFFPELEKCYTLLKHFHSRLDSLTSNFSPNSPISKIHSAFQPYVKQIFGDLFLEMEKKLNTMMKSNGKSDSENNLSQLLQSFAYFFTSLGGNLKETIKSHPDEREKKSLKEIKKKWVDVIDYINLVNIYSNNMKMFLKNKKVTFEKNYPSCVIPDIYRACDVSLFSQKLSPDIHFSSSHHQYKIIITKSTIILMSFDDKCCSFLFETSFRDMFFLKEGDFHLKIYTLFGLFEIEEIGPDKDSEKNFYKIVSRIQDNFKKMNKKYNIFVQNFVPGKENQTIYVNYVDKDSLKVESIQVKIAPDNLPPNFETVKEALGDKLLEGKVDFLRLSPFLL